MQSAPFHRAWRFLKFQAGFKFLAQLSAVLSAALYLVLLGLLFLFCDLIVSKGSILAFGQLSPVQRVAFHDELANADAAEDAPALTWDQFAERKLEQRVGPAAAEAYRTRTVASDAPRPELGVLTLIHRIETPWLGKTLGWFASWNTWAWQPKLAGRPNQSYIVGLLLVFLAVSLLRAVCIALNDDLAIRAVTEATTRLRRGVYHHTFRLGTLAIRAFGTSEASSVFTRQAEAVSDAFVAKLTMILRETLKFFLLLAAALLVDFWLGLTFVLLALLVWLVAGMLGAHYRSLGRTATRHGAASLALLQESIMLMRLVKVYLMERFNQSRVERQLADYAEAQVERSRYNTRYHVGFVFICSAAAAVLLAVAGIVLLRDGTTLPQVIVLAAAVCSLYYPLMCLIEGNKVMRRGREAAAAMFEFLDRRADVTQAAGAEFLSPLTRGLEFVDVSLREPGTGRMLLDGVSFKVEAGSKVALVGPDPVELHALVYLIPRFLDPSSGELQIDGQNLRWVTLDSLRHQTAVILQHNLIFNDTVANNIGCGEEGFQVPQIIEAAKVAHAHQFIQQLPYGYETRVGEQGTSLTAGQKFRIALARAILRDPALLIIEEPADEPDDETRQFLDDTLERMLEGRTVIFLPHRAATVKRCDRIFLIRDGRIEASGEHRELLGNSDLYRHLHYLEHNAFAGEVRGI